MKRPLLRLTMLACSALIVCAGDDEAATDTATTTSTTSTTTDTTTSSTSADTSSGATDPEGTSSSTTTLDSDTASTTAESTSTTLDSDTAATTAAESCRDNQFLGLGIAADGWGLGAFCDRLYLCAEPPQQAAIEAAAPAFLCAPSPGEQFSCPKGQIECGPPGQTQLDDRLYDQLCAALAVPGVELAYCLVLGP